MGPTALMGDTEAAMEADTISSPEVVRSSVCGLKLARKERHL